MFLFFCLYFIIIFRFYFIPLFINIIIFFSKNTFLIMIFPLLVSGVRVWRLCWVGQEPAVLAAVG